MFLLILLTSVFAEDLLKKCYLDKFNLGDSEIKILTHYEQIIADNKPIDYECLELVITKGYYRLALTIYETYFLINHIDISERISTFLKNERNINQKDIQTIFKLAMTKSNQVQVLQPVVLWAQSKNHTLINIKFSHRQDAPACLNAKLDILDIKENSLLIEAFGVVSHIPIRYRYEIQLFKAIDPTKTIKQLEAVGTMVLNLTKAETGLWLRLTDLDVKTPIWWDIRDNLKKDMDEFVILIEKESERKEKEADKLYKKSQKKRQQEKEKYEKMVENEKQRKWNYEHNQNYIQDKCENGWYQRQ